MKRFFRCPNCGDERAALPRDKRFGGGYKNHCDKCGTNLIVVGRFPHELHFDLLAYALAHLKEGETRAAVLEVFAALDVFARMWGKAALEAAGTPAPIVARFTDPDRVRTRHLLKLALELFPKKAFEALPNSVFKLRNDVIHAGKTPTPEEAAAVEKHVRLWITHTQYAGRPEISVWVSKER